MDKNIDLLLRSEIARIVESDVKDIDMARSFGELGFDSVGYVEFASFVKKRLGVPLNPETLFEHNSIYETMACIANLLEGAKQADVQASTIHDPATASAITQYDARDVAIIGASIRIPGAADMDALWNLVAQGGSMISKFPAQRAPASDVHADVPGFLCGGFIEDADAFDAAFFGISPREALAMDPQQRLALEAGWHAFEDAGYTVDRLSGSDTAVFIGASSFDYYELLNATKAARTTHIGTGVSHAIIANRLSQFFNLKGASETIDSACASSLVALMRGVNAVRRGENRLVLAGGVNLLASRTPFQVFADAGMLSKNGICRPFDDGASGYVRGEGAGFVVLKHAEAAVRDGDRILAIIKGGAVQHSGRTQSLTAPNPEAQASVIAAALEDAGVDPASIGYVEAHGTGTALGDPIEAQGLQKAFSRMHEKWGRPSPTVAPHFYIGSIKAQIGHLEAAAGVVGLLKAVGALMHRSIPGSPYLRHINPLIALKESAFRIPHATLPWNSAHAEVNLPLSPRRAGVSSFGFGGTNAHIVLEEVPKPAVQREAQIQSRLFLFSAKSTETLRALCARFALDFGHREFANFALEQGYLEDVAFTLRTRRSALPFRFATLASSLAELAATLRVFAEDGSHTPDSFVGEAFHGSQSRIEQGLSDAVAIGAANSPVLAKQGDLPTLAQLWVHGARIDWDDVLPRESSMSVPLPHYPFVRDRFWVYSEAVEKAQLPVADNIGPVAAYYRTRWIPAPLGAAASLPLKGALLVLVAGVRGQLVADTVRRLTSRIPMQLIYCPRIEESSLQLPENSMSGPFEAVLDLTAIDEQAYLQLKIPDKLEIFRRFVSRELKRGDAIKIVHATCGLQDLGVPNAIPVSLAGAQDTGLFEHFSAEYKRCISKTVDFSGCATETENLAASLIHELQQHDGNHGIAYFDQQRYVRCMERIDLPLPVSQPDVVGAAMITGGTGDIGLCLARDLVERGSRALLLTGRSALSPSKLAQVQELEQCGARISFYRGELDDAVTMRLAIDNFRAEHGAITHVFHCAGTADKITPAFFQKTSASIAQIMAPKVSALETLHELFLDEPPQAFVLFSSLASVAPKSAAGVLDYASANRFLDLFSHYQHGQGHQYYRSIQWTRWENLGLAKNVTAAGTGQPLAATHCLSALHAVLAAGNTLPASICVLAEGDPILTASPNAAASLSESSGARQATPAVPTIRMETIRATLRTLVAKELETTETKLDDRATFEALGIDSIVLMGLIAGIEAWLGVVVDPQELIDRNSIEAVAHYLEEKLSPDALVKAEAIVATRQTPADTENGDRRMQDSKKVAVIGMACRFPGARDKEMFWHNLKSGVDSVGVVPPSRWNKEAIYAPLHAAGHSISQWGGFIDDIEWVNPKLFGMNAEEAADIDPLVRLFTECSMEAASDSAHGIDGLKGKRVGVFVGARAGGYAERIEHPGKHSVTGIGQNFVAAHVTHLLDLRGPSLVLDSACSSSLAAIHLACQSLFCGDSEMAMAGGVEVLLDEKPYLFLSAAHALSPDGRCRPFDAKANGFVPGEGVGCVLLKPLDRALADGDPIYAVIEGSAMNNDGHTLGITTPGGAGQVDVIERALSHAALTPRDISYVEAHGTGTLIGDPIELQSLARAFKSNPPIRCAVGSVKSNLGHLMSASGVASFIKVALALHHKMLPPTLNCEEVNPRFDFERTPFYPVRTQQKWDSDTMPRYAGINAFGFGKTNVHMLLGERPATAPSPQIRLGLPSSDARRGKVRAWHADGRAKKAAVVGEKSDALLLINVEYFEELEIESEA